MFERWKPGISKCERKTETSRCLKWTTVQSHIKSLHSVETTVRVGERGLCNNPFSVSADDISHYLKESQNVRMSICLDLGPGNSITHWKISCSQLFDEIFLSALHLGNWFPVPNTCDSLHPLETWRDVHPFQSKGTLVFSDVLIVFSHQWLSSLYFMEFVTKFSFCMAESFCFVFVGSLIRQKADFAQGHRCWGLEGVFTPPNFQIECPFWQ